MLQFLILIFKKISLGELILSIFYFLSACLFLSLVSELLVSGLFALYFNSAVLAILWLASAIISLLYVRQ